MELNAQEKHSEIEALQFTRAVPGLGPSPFCLGTVIKYHLDSWKELTPDATAELRKSLFVGRPGVTVDTETELKAG